MSTQNQSMPSAAAAQQTADKSDTKIKPVEDVSPIPEATVEVYFRSLVKEKTEKGLPKDSAEEIALRQIERDAKNGLLDMGVVRAWRAKTNRVAVSAVRGEGAPLPGTPAGEIENEFKDLVSKKMNGGLKRQMAVDCAIRQIDRDAHKYDPVALDQWRATIKKRAGSVMLGIQ